MSPELAELKARAKCRAIPRLLLQLARDQRQQERLAAALLLAVEEQLDRCLLGYAEIADTTFLENEHTVEIRIPGHHVICTLFRREGESYSWVPYPIGHPEPVDGISGEGSQYVVVKPDGEKKWRTGTVGLEEALLIAEFTPEEKAAEAEATNAPF